jgi:hypothetical protein
MTTSAVAPYVASGAKYVWTSKFTKVIPTGTLIGLFRLEAITRTAQRLFEYASAERHDGSSAVH